MTASGNKNNLVYILLCYEKQSSVHFALLPAMQKKQFSFFWLVYITEEWQLVCIVAMCNLSLASKSRTPLLKKVWNGSCLSYCRQRTSPTLFQVFASCSNIVLQHSPDCMLPTNWNKISIFRVKPTSAIQHKMCCLSSCHRLPQTILRPRVQAKCAIAKKTSVHLDFQSVPENQFLLSRTNVGFI